MKVSEYIKCLQNLKNKHDDIEIEINREVECSDLSINNTFENSWKALLQQET